MKILLATDFFPPTITGSAVHVYVLAKHLRRLGHHVLVVTVAQKNAKAFGDDEEGFMVYRINGMFQKLGFLYRDSSLRHHPPMRDGLVVKGLERIVREEKPDLIHTHGWIVHSAIPVKREFGLPLVHTLHDYGLICPKKSMLKDNVVCNPLTTSCIRCGVEQYGVWKSFLTYNGVKRSLEHLKYVDKFIAVSNWVKKAHEAYFGPLMTRKTAVIPNFYDCEAMDLRNEGDVNSEEVLPEDFFLFVGNLIPAKGVDVLLEAFRQVNEETYLVILGKRHPAYNYERYASQRVIVFPDAPSKLVHKAYSRCRFVLVPSLAPDPCPTVALEAMSHSKALIASDIGGLRDIVLDGETGVFVHPESVGNLVEVMRYLFGSPSLTKVMGQAGRKRLNGFFSTEVIVPRIAQLYREIRGPSNCACISGKRVRRGEYCCNI